MNGKAQVPLLFAFLFHQCHFLLGVIKNIVRSFHDDLVRHGSKRRQLVPTPKIDSDV